MTRREFAVKLITANLKKYRDLIGVEPMTLAELGYSLSKIDRILLDYSGNISIEMETGRYRTEQLSNSYKLSKDLFETLRKFRNSVIHLNTRVLPLRVEKGNIYVDSSKAVIIIKHSILELFSIMREEAPEFCLDVQLSDINNSPDLN